MLQRRFVLIIGLCLLAPIARASESRDDFLDEFKQALSHHDLPALDRLSYKQGLDSTDLVDWQLSLNNLCKFKATKVEFVSLQRNFNKLMVSGNEVKEYVFDPVGEIQLVRVVTVHGTRPDGSTWWNSTSQGIMVPYAVVAGHYCLVAVRTVLLNK